MNNKGQTLVLFVLILPLIILFLSFFVDLSKVRYEKDKINSIILSNLEVIVNNDIRDIELIKSVYLENDLLVNVFINEDIIMINTDMKIKSIFGKILDFDVYEVDVNYIGNYLNKEVRYEKD